LGNGICISTGYAPIGKRVDYETYRTFDEAAREIWNTECNCEKAEKRVEHLIADFIGTIKGSTNDD
jgi:hypothetical protein